MFRRLVTFVSVLSMLAFGLLPASQASADIGGSTTEVGSGRVDESTPPVDGNNSPVGQLLLEGASLAKTTHQGVDVIISGEGAISAVRSPLAGKDLAVVRALTGDSEATGMLVTNVAGGVEYFVSTDDTGFAVLAKIASSGSDHELSFGLGLPSGATLVSSEDGSVDVLGDDRYSIGTFETPWAVDANGNQVPTSFKIDGSSITQVIKPDKSTVYPIIADPKFTWGWVSGTVYFNKTETLSICVLGWEAILLMVTANVWLGVISLRIAIIAAKACLANLAGKCLKVKSYGSVGYYDGGYCE